MMKIPLTLVLVHQHPKILLGMKKRGFGAGRWNGFGGKVLEDETIEEAAIREMQEEANILVKELEKVGILEFESKGKAEVLEVHIFRTEKFQGKLLETEEMRPKWFHTDLLPFGEMWPDDRYWLPLFLEGKKFKGRFLFGENDSILEKELTEVEEL